MICSLVMLVQSDAFQKNAKQRTTLHCVINFILLCIFFFFLEYPYTIRKLMENYYLYMDKISMIILHIIFYYRIIFFLLYVFTVMLNSKQDKLVNGRLGETDTEMKWHETFAPHFYIQQSTNENNLFCNIRTKGAERNWHLNKAAQ